MRRDPLRIIEPLSEDNLTRGSGNTGRRGKVSTDLVGGVGRNKATTLMRNEEVINMNLHADAPNVLDPSSVTASPMLNVGLGTTLHLAFDLSSRGSF